MAVGIGTILAQWEAVGVFDYLLPFLLIFAIVYGILAATNILGPNKGIHVVIAFVIGLLALRLDLVPQFFSEIFPRLGVGLAVIVALLILVGLFIGEEERRYWYWGLGAIGVAVFLIVISQSFDKFSWYSSYSMQDSVGYIIGGVLIIGLIIAIAASNSDKSSHNPNSGKLTMKANQWT